MDSGTLTYCVYRLAGAAAPRIPPRVGYRLAERLGDLIYRSASARVVVEENISYITGEPPSSPRVQRIARQVFRNQAKNYYDLLRVASLDSHTIRVLVRELSGMAHLDSALAKGHGIVLTSAHFGNVDIAGQIIAVSGHRVTGIAEHIQPERLFQYVRKQRESHGLRFIPIDGSLRPVFRALRANEIVASAMDRDVTDTGRLVSLLGRPARLPDGYLRLALRTGAALLVGFARRLPDDTFSVTFEPEIELERTGDMERDVQMNLPKALSIWERYLSRYPDQWVYFQPVWLSEHSRPN